MGIFSSNKGASGGSTPNWSPIESESQLSSIVAQSDERPQVIFKHSTTCFISKTVLRNFEAEWSAEGIEADIHLLDLLQFRPISNAIAEQLSVTHQSPQIIVLSKGGVVLHNSHQAISAEEVMKQISTING